jgi:hypothetical protein
MSSKWSPSLRLSHQSTVCTSPFSHTDYMYRQSHSSRFDIRIVFGEEYRSWSVSLCSLIHSPFTSSLGRNVNSNSIKLTWCRCSHQNRWVENMKVTGLVCMWGCNKLLCFRLQGTKPGGRAAELVIRQLLFLMDVRPTNDVLGFCNTSYWLWNIVCFFWTITWGACCVFMHLIPCCFSGFVCCVHKLPLSLVTCRYRKHIEEMCANSTRS